MSFPYTSFQSLQGTISVIIPAYNEQEVISEFYSRIKLVVDKLPYEFRFVFVNDGSRDSTAKIVADLHLQDPRVELIDLSRNFGKEVAMTAGLDHAIGDAVIIIDADLQDPPEIIPKLIDTWQSGYDVAYAKRVSRDGETLLKKIDLYRTKSDPILLPKPVNFSFENML